jgi:signal transduction histidine kinase
MSNVVLRRGLTAAQAVTAAILLLVAGLLASAYQDRSFRAQRVHELTVQGEVLAASVTAALVFDDAKAVQEHVSALAINPDIAAAAVYRASGRLVASFARNGAELLPASVATAEHESGHTLVAVAVIHSRERLGSVVIRARDELLVRRLSRHVPMMLLAIMAALLLVVMGTSQRALTATNARLETEMEERSKAEDALRQSQKMEAVGRLAGGVAHDFNNLLTIIQGNLHLLRILDAGDRETMQAYIGSADGAADRAANLVRRLLAFSRSQTLAPRPVELNELVTGMKDLIVHSVGDAVGVVWDLKATWSVLCDVNQMESVILNVAINARDAMPEGGTLTLRTLNCPSPGGDIEPGDYVELRVADTGIGMTDDVRKRAIDPFFTTKPHGRGTGLGLSTAFAFVRQSNGYLKIESMVGKGTSIIILLPRYTGATMEAA